MGAMQSFSSVLPTLTSALNTVQTISNTVNTVKSLTGSHSDDLALQQLQETQVLQAQQQADTIALQKQSIAEQAAQDEEDRLATLRRAVASQRASYGASGISSASGSSEAVLLGLIEENEDESESSEAANVLKLQALDQGLSQQQA